MKSCQRRAVAIRAVDSDNRGAVALVVAMSATALAGMLALALDASSAISAHTRLRQAADTGALAAVRQAVVLMTSNDDPSVADQQRAIAETAGAERFKAQAESIPRVNMPDVTVQVSRKGATVTATVSFRGTYATQLAGALSGISSDYGSIASLPLVGTAAAQQTVGTFVDIQVLMDTSNSMAITATPDSGTKLWALTNLFTMWGNPGWSGYWGGCTVACHAVMTNQYKIAPIWDYNQQPPTNGGVDYSWIGAPSTSAPASNYSWWPTGGFTWWPTIGGNPSNYPPANNVTYQQDPTQYDYYALARWAGLTLRIDLLKGAVGSIASAVAAAPEADRFRFGFYTFDLDVTQRYALGPASGITSQVSSVDVTPFPGGYPSTLIPGVPSQTNVGVSIKAFTNNPTWMVPAGDGSSPEQAKKVVVIMTDGVEDYNDSGGNRVTSPFHASACDQLKRSTTAIPPQVPGMGANIFVLQAADPSNFISGGVDDQGNSLDPTAMFNASVAAMQACATDKTYYFLATSPQDIQDATNKIINSALSKPTVLTLDQPNGAPRAVHGAGLGGP